MTTLIAINRVITNRIRSQLLSSGHWIDVVSTEPERLGSFQKTIKEKESETNMNLLKKFLASEDGPTAVEYAVMLALIVVVCIGTITAIGTKVNTTFTNVKTALP